MYSGNYSFGDSGPYLHALLIAIVQIVFMHYIVALYELCVCLSGLKLVVGMDVENHLGALQLIYRAAWSVYSSKTHHFMGSVCRQSANQ